MLCCFPRVSSRSRTGAAHRVLDKDLGAGDQRPVRAQEPASCPTAVDATATKGVSQPEQPLLPAYNHPVPPAAAANADNSALLHHTCTSGLSGTEPSTDGFLHANLKVDFEDLTFHELIGKGSTKSVYRGRWNSTMVAIVCMRRGGVVADARFLQLLSNHPNLVQFYRWAADDNGNEYILLELVRLGSLDKLLFVQGNSIRTRDRLAMCEQICGAMCELADAGVLHRDLAARNILVQSMEPVHVKVADLGLAYAAADSVVLSGGELDACVPVRWTAPEVLLQGKFSQKSDVWAYGITLWEIFTNGSEPYASKTDQEVMEAVVNGEVLPQPEGCPNELYGLMQHCWCQDPRQRPSFREVAQQLRQWRREHMLAFQMDHSNASLARIGSRGQMQQQGPPALVSDPHQVDLVQQYLQCMQQQQVPQPPQPPQPPDPGRRLTSEGSTDSLHDLPRPLPPAGHAGLITPPGDAVERTVHLTRRALTHHLGSTGELGGPESTEAPHRRTGCPHPHHPSGSESDSRLMNCMAVDQQHGPLLPVATAAGRSSIQPLPCLGAAAGGSGGGGGRGGTETGETGEGGARAASNAEVQGPIGQQVAVLQASGRPRAAPEPGPSPLLLLGSASGSSSRMEILGVHALMEQTPAQLQEKGDGGPAQQQQWSGGLLSSSNNSSSPHDCTATTLVVAQPGGDAHDVCAHSAQHVVDPPSASTLPQLAPAQPPAPVGPLPALHDDGTGFVFAAAGVPVDFGEATATLHPCLQLSAQPAQHQNPWAPTLTLPPVHLAAPALPASASALPVPSPPPQMPPPAPDVQPLLLVGSPSPPQVAPHSPFATVSHLPPPPPQSAFAAASQSGFLAHAQQPSLGASTQPAAPAPDPLSPARAQLPVSELALLPLTPGMGLEGPHSNPQAAMSYDLDCCIDPMMSCSTMPTESCYPSGANSVFGPSLGCDRAKNPPPSPVRRSHSGGLNMGVSSSGNSIMALRRACSSGLSACESAGGSGPTGAGAAAAPPQPPRVLQQLPARLQHASFSRQRSISSQMQQASPRHRHNLSLQLASKPAQAQRRSTESNPRVRAVDRPMACPDSLSARAARLDGHPLGGPQPRSTHSAHSMPGTPGGSAVAPAQGWPAAGGSSTGGLQQGQVPFRYAPVQQRSRLFCTHAVDVAREQAEEVQHHSPHPRDQQQQQQQQLEQQHCNLNVQQWAAAAAASAAAGSVGATGEVQRARHPLGAIEEASSASLGSARASEDKARGATALGAVQALTHGVADLDQQQQQQQQQGASSSPCILTDSLLQQRRQQQQQQQQQQQYHSGPLSFVRSLGFDSERHVHQAARGLPQSQEECDAPKRHLQHTPLSAPPLHLLSSDDVRHAARMQQALAVQQQQQQQQQQQFASTPHAPRHSLPLPFLASSAAGCAPHGPSMTQAWGMQGCLPQPAPQPAPGYVNMREVIQLSNKAKLGC